MKDTVKNINQNICANMTEIHKDLELVLKHIFEKAGSKIQPEKQSEYYDAIAHTKQVIERFKNQYGCVSILNQNY